MIIHTAQYMQTYTGIANDNSYGSQHMLCHEDIVIAENR